MGAVVEYIFPTNNMQEVSPKTAVEFYQQGLAHARRSEWGEAATCFKHAVALDPNSPAGESLKMVESIQTFYYKDNFNP